MIKFEYTSFLLNERYHACINAQTIGPECEMVTKEIPIVRWFNEAINRHDVEALCTFMAPDDTFIDSGGGVTETTRKGWKEFFQMFPDYHNEMLGFLQSGNTIMAI